MWRLTGQPEQVQLEPQLQEPEEEQPQSPIMSVVEAVDLCSLVWFGVLLSMVVDGES